ncbi:hypothetical protein Tco_1291714 [Tanacetum coccineum]
MVVPNDDETDYIREVISVEYEWKPPRCVDCKIFCHSSARCPKIIRETVTFVSTDTNSNGFTLVQRKKIKDKKADLQSRSRQSDNILLNKPKPNLYWQKKGTIRKGADMDPWTKATNKDECTSSSRGNQEEEHEVRLDDPKLNEHDEFNEEVDEFIFPKGEKFGDKFDIRLKCQVRK